jgi:hypothetical protein
LECHFVIAEAEWSVKELLALVLTFATGPIWLTAGMVMVEGRQQPLIQPIHDESYHCIPLVPVGTTSIIRISAIQGAVHHLPLTPQPESSWWYLPHIIDLNAAHLLYMWIIRLNAWSNRCSDISKPDQCLLWVSWFLSWELCKLVYNQYLKQLNSSEYYWNQRISLRNCQDD